MPARHRKHKISQTHTDTPGSVDDLRAIMEDPSVATYWGTLVPELLVSVLSGNAGMPSDGWTAVADAWRLFITGGDTRTRSEGQ